MTDKCRKCVNFVERHCDNDVDIIYKIYSKVCYNLKEME